MERVYAELGKRISAKRKERDLSQIELAQHVALTRTSISNIENGRQHLPIHQLYRFAEVLECSVHELLPESAALFEAESPELQLASKTERSDLRKFLSTIQRTRSPRKE